MNSDKPLDLARANIAAHGSLKLFLCPKCKARKETASLGRAAEPFKIQLPVLPYRSQWSTGKNGSYRSTLSLARREPLDGGSIRLKFASAGRILVCYAFRFWLSVETNENWYIRNG